MFSLFSHENLENIKNALVKRFSIPSILVLIMSAYLIYQIAVDGKHEDMIFTIFSTLMLVFFLSVGVTVWRENAPSSRWNIFYTIAPFLYGALYFLYFQGSNAFSIEQITFFGAHLIGFVAFLFFAAYLSPQKPPKDTEVEYQNYFTRVAWSFLMSMIVGGITLALGAIAITAIITLFDIQSYPTWDKLYGYWAVFSLVFIAPLNGLATFPVRARIDTKKYETNVFFRFLVKYVVVPFVFVYFVILYAYSIRVLADFSDWPKGIVSWLVISFSSLGYLAYIFSKPYESEGKYIAIFRRYFPWFVLPQILMLAYAIYLRIDQYGLTTNRYFVVIFGVWLLIISLGLIIAKRKHSSIIPTTLTAIALLVSVGPWSVFTLPLAHQESLLFANLREAGMINADGRITPAPKGISTSLSDNIASRIEYICDYENCERIKRLFPDVIQDIENRKKSDATTFGSNTGDIVLGRWEVVTAVHEYLGVSSYYGSSTSEPRYIVLYSNLSRDPFPMDTRGYDTVYMINQYWDSTTTTTSG